MCDEAQEWRTTTLGDLAGSFSRIMGAFHSLDDQLIYYMREHEAIRLDVFALAEALGLSIRVGKQYSPSYSPSSQESSSVLMRRCIEEVRRLTGKPKEALKEVQTE